METLKDGDKKLKSVFGAHQYVVKLEIKKFMTEGGTDDCQESKILRYDLFIQGFGISKLKLQSILGAHFCRNNKNYKDVITGKNNSFWIDLKHFIFTDLHGVYESISDFIINGESDYTQAHVKVYAYDADWVEELMVECIQIVD